MSNPPPPSRTQNDDLLSSEDSLFVKQPQGNPHVGEDQHGQAIPQKSRDPVNTFPRPLMPEQQRADAALLKEPFTNGRFTGNLLLSRPAFKPLELNQGFEYGEPIPIDPDQFSRRMGTPVPPHTKDQPSRSHAGLPVSTSTAAKPMPPKPPFADPKLDGNSASGHLPFPPPRSNHDLDSSIARRVSDDTYIGRLPLKKKTSQTQDVERPLPLPPRIEAQGRVRNTDESTELMEPPFPPPARIEAQGRVRKTNESAELRAVSFEQQPVFPVDHHDMPPPSRDLDQKERAITKRGQEQTSTHHDQASRGPKGTISERSNLETVDGQTSPGNSDRQQTTADSRSRQHRHSDTTAEPFHGFSPQLAHARGTEHDESSHTAPISEEDPAFRGSNVSNRRSTCPESHQPLRSTHSSSDARSESFASSPLHLGVKNTHELSTSMAKAINHFNISQKTEIDRQKSHYKRKLRAFERKVAEKCDMIEREEVEIAKVTKEIKALRHSISTMADQIQSLEARLKESEAQNQSMAEYNQTMQDQLAKSADESQNLIDRVERRNGELTKEVQALKLSLKQLQDAFAQKETRERELEEQTARDQQEMEDCEL